MIVPVPMQSCADGSVWFPPRYICDHEHEPVYARTGRIEEITVQQSEPKRTFASVRTDLGPVVLARINRDDARPGDEVTLTIDPAGTADDSGLTAFVALSAASPEEGAHSDRA